MSRCNATLDRPSLGGGVFTVECRKQSSHSDEHEGQLEDGQAWKWSAVPQGCPSACAALHSGREHEDVTQHTSIAKAVRDLLLALGVDEGDHTADTPNRVAKAWMHQLSGYGEDPAVHLRKQFSAPEYPGIVIVSGIRLQSTCAHHLLPITGWATVAYRPQPRTNITGLSKLSRLVDGYARRLQVQERIGAQVVDALERELHPAGGACIITAAHGCMTIRGVQEHEALTTTTSVVGEWISPTHPELAEVYHQHRAMKPRA